MANKTSTLGLTKPLRTEDYNVEDFNSNADKIDNYAKSTSKNITNLESSIDKHSHALNGTGIKGVLPISKGGTGATTASVAAKNLGITAILQQKADKEHKHTAKDIAETDEIKLMTATERNKLAQLTKYCYVVAAEDTDSKLKEYANVRCTGSAMENFIQTLIDYVARGSTIYLLPGTYKISKPIRLGKSINFLGEGAETKLVNLEGGYIFSVTNSCVRLKDMQLIRNSELMNSTSNKALIEFYSSESDIISDVEIRGCLFDCKNMGENQGAIIGVFNPITLESLTQVRILENTFLAADYTGNTIDFSNIGNSLSGVVGANVSSNGIKIKAQNTTSVWTYGQRTILL